MTDDEIMKHIGEMEERIIKHMDDIKVEIIDEIETSLMEIGVYKKEIIDYVKKSKPSKNE